MRKTTTFGAAMFALAASGWIATAAAQAPAADPAPPAPTTDAAPPAAAPDATPAKPAHHKKMMSAKSGHGMGKLKGTAKGDAAVEDLNAKSLDAAKSGKSFSAPTTPISEPEAHEKGGKMAPAHAMKMKHHMAKKMKGSTPDASAPAPAPDAGPAPEAAPSPAPAPETPK